MAIPKRIFLLVMLLFGALQLQAQYVIIGLPVGGYLTPVCPMDSNGVSATLSVTMTPNTTWGPPSGNATFELVNVYNTAQVYSSVVAPTFPGGNNTTTVVFKLPKLNAYCDDTMMMQVRVTIAGATPSSIYSSTALGVRYQNTSQTVMNSNPPYQDLIPYYIEHCPGVFPQMLGAAYYNFPGTQYKWQVKSGSVWTNIFGGSGYTASASYNATANGTYRCVVRSPVCDNCYTVTSEFIVKDIDALQIASFSPSGTSPQLYTPGMSLQRSAPAASYTYTGYQWYRNGVPIAGATANVYVPTAKGTYTLSGSGPCGWQMSNPFVLTDNCEPAGYKWINGPNLSGSYSGKNLMKGEYTVPLGSVAVFNAADIVMMPCTRITVANGGTLNVRASTLRSCMQWYGIVVARGGTLVVDTSTVSDAYIAVTGEDDNAKIDIQRSTFRDDHLSIWLRKNKTKNIQNIHDNNLFTDIDLTNGDPGCENMKAVAPTIDPLHDYIFIDGSNLVNISRNNTFKGFPVATPPDLYACPVIAIQANGSVSVNINTGNKFSDMLLDGVLMNDCSKSQITNSNLFTAIGNYGNAVCINGGSDINIDNANSVSNYAYGVKAIIGGSRISVLGNSFSNNLFGISFNKLSSYKVDGNIINSKYTGMETYNDSHTALMPPPYRISNNIFQGLYQGLIISPVKNPLNSATTAGNKLVAGPQNVQVLCNNFAGNTIAITGSAPIVDQYYSGQQWASNTFNQNSLWDIAWVDSPAVVDMNYYYDAALTGPNVYIPNNSYSGQLQPAFAMNGVTVSTSFVAVTPTGNSTGNCSYDPYTNPAARYAGIGAVVNNNNTVAVYPNPAADWLNIDVVNLSAFDYTILNLTGQIIQSGKGNASAKIKMAGLTPGIYLLKVVLAGGEVHNYRFMKE